MQNGKRVGIQRGTNMAALVTSYKAKSDVVFITGLLL